MKKIMFAMMSVLLLSVVMLADSPETGENEAKYYDNAKVIRIKNVEGEAFVQRSYNEGNEEATPNLPIFEKDTVGTTAGRLGIYLGRLNYMRLDSDTLVELLNIPELRKTDLVARVEKGAIYLDIENLDKEKSIEIQTPDCGIFLLDKGVYRINVDENSMTEVYVLEGIAEVAGQENSRNVRENQKIVMSRGKVEERPYDFYASEKDDFDRWNETQNREQGYARYSTARYLQSGYEDYEYEMSRSGRWSYMSDYNSYVWAPYYSNADWMPYSNGRWVYNPYYGYVWTSYDNCGWFTHHYGRWHWNYSGGWYWIPAYHWSPAWVSWFGDNDYYGWCPLSWWNRPVVIINNRWDRNYDYRRGIPRHSHSTIIIRKNELTAVNAMHVALNKNNLEPTGAKLIAYRGTAPGERSTIAKVSVVNARGKTVTYKQNSIVSGEKYKISNDAGEAGKTVVYKYNRSSDANGQYSPHIYRSKDVDQGSKTRTGGYYRSKTSGESSANTRVRSSDSSSSGDKSQTKVSARGNSTNSSSSTSSSTKAAKKKKDEAAYMALLQSENSAGYKSHSTSSTDYQTGYSANSNDSNRFSSRVYESRTGGEQHSSANYAAANANRFSGARESVSTRSGYVQNGYSPRSESSSGRARSSAFGSSQATRSDNPSRAAYSAPARSSARSMASSSPTSSSTTGTAKKRR